MKNLLFIILVAFALPANSQEYRNPQDPNDHRRIKNPAVQYLNPNDPNDHRRVVNKSTDTNYFRRVGRPKGTIGVIVGSSITLAGVALIYHGDGSNFGSGFVLALAGVTTTLVSGGLIISDLYARHHHRYSVVIHPNYIGFAYQF